MRNIILFSLTPFILLGCAPALQTIQGSKSTLTARILAPEPLTGKKRGEITFKNREGASVESRAFVLLGDKLSAPGCTAVGDDGLLCSSEAVLGDGLNLDLAFEGTLNDANVSYYLAGSRVGRLTTLQK